MGLQDRDWYWAERDRKERENARSEPVLVFLPRTPPPAKRRPPESATFGAARPPLSWRQLGLLAIASAVLVLASFSLERAVRQSREAAAAAEQKEKQTVSAERAADERRKHFTALAAVQEAERARVAAVRAEVEAAAKAKAAEASRQSAAWAQFYKPDPQCSTSWTVDCANAYIRAKRRFAQQAP
jgi:hypothetical protein